MRKKASWTVAVGWILSSLLFQGCATKYIPLNKRDLTSLAPLTVVSYVLPYYGVRVRHDGGEIAGIVVGVVSTVGGIATSSAVNAWKSTLEKEIAAARVPRFYELVMKKFVARASKEIPGWPPMVVDEYPVSREYIKNFLRRNQVLYYYWFKNMKGLLYLAPHMDLKVTIVLRSMILREIRFG